MIVGICKLSIHFPETHSLKEKRQALRKIKDRTAHQFHVQIAEVGELELWQKAELGFAIVGNGGNNIRSLMQKIVRFLEEMHVGQILNCEEEVVHF